MAESAPKQARIDPVYEADALNQKVIGWTVIDISQPENETVVSEHETQAEAIKAAEEFEQYAQ
ncbi:hypothetical protein [Phytohalomonas tamaricis]|uniref:hypothetical protein n=1 Tax=Phytohalomonas tamaricis TaxID=2081032 RepID=UPI000D0ACB46|nr:hypothetical protein [Phytohalomonas tamaricis]